jgi:hypothetical protein
VSHAINNVAHALMETDAHLAKLEF